MFLCIKPKWKSYFWLDSLNCQYYKVGTNLLGKYLIHNKNLFTYCTYIYQLVVQWYLSNSPNRFGCWYFG